MEDIVKVHPEDESMKMKYIEAFICLISEMFRRYNQSKNKNYKEVLN
jgi:hypothetical protein